MQNIANSLLISEKSGGNMGGMGSGRRWRYDAKNTTANYRTIDIRRWQREGLLSPSKSFTWNWWREEEITASISVRVEVGRIILSYRHRNNCESWQSENYSIKLNWMPCNFGGKRPWFLCPASGCGQRVAILYNGGNLFACRRCYQLAYPSQREVSFDRAWRRAEKIRAQLGWEPGIMNGCGWQKPKGMHWEKFDRLTSKHNELLNESLTGASLKFGVKFPYP